MTITTASGTQTLAGENTMAYTSIRSGETLYKVKDHFDYEYACFATITSLAADSEYTKLDIRAYVTTAEGEVLYGNSVTLVYTGLQDAQGFPALTVE